MRLLALSGLLLAGFIIVLLAYPFLPARWRPRLKRQWSRLFLACLGLRLVADLPHWQAGSLIVANHVSWLDIFALNAAFETGFVSKAEVRQWPLIGWLAAKNDTVFLRRGSRGHARIVNGEIAALLEAGRCLTVFPEGTTTDGTHLLHFHAALLQPALEVACPLLVVALSYHQADGTRSLAPAYVGETTLWQSLQAILRCRRLIIRVKSCVRHDPQPSATGGLDTRERRQLARWSRAAILEAIGLPAAEPADEATTGHP